PREEVLHRDELVVRGDDGIGALLERQADAHPDRLLPARAFHAGGHDPGTSAGDDHPTVLRQFGRHGACLAVLLAVGPPPGGAEHTADPCRHDGGTVGSVTSCPQCGAGSDRTDDSVPLGWMVERQPRTGRMVATCPTCARRNVRSIEGKLDTEWW